MNGRKKAQKGRETEELRGRWLIKPVEKLRVSRHLARMSVFESTAVLDDPMHLTLGRPVPDGPSRHCRVIVMFETEPEQEAWPQGFLDEIRIDDAAFERPVQLLGW